jgi:hypothetical protein
VGCRVDAMLPGLRIVTGVKSVTGSFELMCKENRRVSTD